MRAVGPLLALVLVPLFAGCAEVRLEGLTRSDGPREPHYEEHRELVAPQHDKTYPVEVPADATLLNATLKLTPRGNGVGVPDTPVPGAPKPTAAPAELEVEVLDAAGRAVAAAKVDPSHPEITLLVEEFGAPGAWSVRVRGVGAAGTVDGQDYGAAYLLSIEMRFG